MWCGYLGDAGKLGVAAPHDGAGAGALGRAVVSAQTAPVIPVCKRIKQIFNENCVKCLYMRVFVFKICNWCQPRPCLDKLLPATQHLNIPGCSDTAAGHQTCSACTSKMVPSLQGCSSVIFVGLTFHVRVDVVCVWPAAARVSESQSNQLFSCLQCTMLAAGGWWWWCWVQLADCRCNSLHYTNVTVDGVLLSAAQIKL